MELFRQNPRDSGIISAKISLIYQKTLDNDITNEKLLKRRKKRKHTESQKEDKGGFREKYKEGVDLYYTDNGSAYINPHEVFMKPVWYPDLFL